MKKIFEKEIDQDKKLIIALNRGVINQQELDDLMLESE